MSIYPEWVIRRAGGRRRYNAERQRNQARRRHLVADLIDDEYQADIARALGVSRSTVCRDVAAIGEWFSPDKARCPYCRQFYAGGHWFNRKPCPLVNQAVSRAL